MNFWFLVFIFVASTGIIGGTYKIYQINRPITAFIYFGGAIAAAVIYGLRWFRPDGTINEATVTSWPPIINVCPDFLSQAKINNKHVCIDTIGVAPNGGIQKNTSNNAGEQFVFDLLTNVSNAEERRKQLCEQCKTKMVTWEGVYDGTQCVGGMPPNPAA